MMISITQWSNGHILLCSSTKILICVMLMSLVFQILSGPSELKISEVSYYALLTFWNMEFYFLKPTIYIALSRIDKWIIFAIWDSLCMFICWWNVISTVELYCIVMIDHAKQLSYRTARTWMFHLKLSTSSWIKRLVKWNRTTLNKVLRHNLSCLTNKYYHSWHMQEPLGFNQLKELYNSKT